jgi:hypothetical protein
MASDNIEQTFRWLRAAGFMKGPKMNTYRLIWAPGGKTIAVVEAKDIKSARRRAPKPYRKYLGEIGVELIAPIVVNKVIGIYRVVWRADDKCYITSIVNGCMVDCFNLEAYRGIWMETGRLPDDVRDAAMALRPGVSS